MSPSRRFRRSAVAEDRGFEPLRALTQPAFQVVEAAFADVRMVTPTLTQQGARTP